MKYRIIISSIVFLMGINTVIRAGEGMWLPLLLGQLNEKEMKEMGMRISAEDIYSINQSSLKDAIVRFGGGCTAEIISDQGLLLTNHHCGLGRIQSHSTIENDYLTNGFWARDNSEELANPGLKVTFLVKMEDVTTKVMEGVTTEMSEAERKKLIGENIKKIKEAAVEGTHFDAVIKPFYYGNEYYLFLTETYKDIRLVGAPPSNIGKFGGDTDNWMWPRHTGDFSLFRIYADSNNMPADYSPNNVPYTPKYHIPISLKGVEEGDFTFVFGFPGRTQEYLPSYAVEMIAEVTNPDKIRLRQERINIMEDAMEKDDLVRIQYAAKLAGVANYWKKMIGESRGIKKIRALDKKRKLEKHFMEWASRYPERYEQYGKLLPEFEKYYAELTPYRIALDYIYEAGLGVELIRNVRNYNHLVALSQNKDLPEAELEENLKWFKKSTKDFFKNYHQPIDRKALARLYRIYRQSVDVKFRPEFFAWIDVTFGADYEAFADYVFDNSIFATESSTLEFLDNYKPKKYKKIEKDPAYKLLIGLKELSDNKLQAEFARIYPKLDSLQRLYMKGLMEMQPDKRFYPDANSTLRVHYGNVDDYFPRDGIKYDYFTTLEGIMQKEDPDIYDYVVEDKLKELYQKKDYGRYADKDGSMHVCFIASNHTTGGNSGSPAMNADGHLVGINFDRNWEGTMSDLMYDPDQCRNIMLDIRYCLFVIDKFAGAGHLVDEMTIIEE